ncbi:MAG: hypothetical protein Q4D96_05470, partial [Propionibacteriaceae bacterium]|nr:hypothetical protein [Propionibacteriaceae bacterium]
PPYGQPPKSNTGLVIALVVALVLVIGGGLALVLTQRGKTVHLDAQGQPQAPGQGQQGQAQPQDQGQAPQGQDQQGQQPQGGPAPAFPKTVGQFTNQSESKHERGIIVLYGSSSDNLHGFGINYLEGATREQVKLAQEYTPVGKWECTDLGGTPACITDAYSGVVVVIPNSGSTKKSTQDEVLSFGEEFLAAWK